MLLNNSSGWFKNVRVPGLSEPASQQTISLAISRAKFMLILFEARVLYFSAGVLAGAE
jgi:hypothetical protein